jgi:heme exporter protein B
LIENGVLFKRQCLRELLIAQREPRAVVNACLFFLMVIVFFPLTMAPDFDALRAIAPGLFWIAILLAMVLSSARLFQQDDEDGVIEQWLVSGVPISILVSAKTLVQWGVTLFPMLLMCPLLGVMFHLNIRETSVLILSLLLGTPAIFALCALAEAFATGVKQKGVLSSLIVLPLTTPIMVFGSATLGAAMAGFSLSGYLALLLALSLLSIILLPFAIAGVIRIGLVE